MVAVNGRIKIKFLKKKEKIILLNIDFFLLECRYVGRYWRVYLLRNELNCCYVSFSCYAVKLSNSFSNRGQRHLHTARIAESKYIFMRVNKWIHGFHSLTASDDCLSICMPAGQFSISFQFKLLALQTKSQQVWQAK